MIHRDIKPSNILVTLHDGKPVPKVIDFGIAKATNQRLTEKTLFTNFAQMIGTPAYMSPEQAEMSGLDVDTRTDVYSLGVLLYELLTGTTPFPEKKLLSKGYGEMQRIIAEEEPERPSLRMSTLVGEQQTIIVKNRADDLPNLTKQVSGDLDWIVMKSLEKDRTRRYETANGLAEDIQRHLNCEPVSAARPSWRYQITKSIQRNKPLFAAATAIAAILIIASVVSTVLAIRTHQANSRSEQARETAQSLNDFVFEELIGLADPENNSQRSLTLLDALDQIDDQISQNFTDRPKLEIEARLALGRAFVFRFDSERSAKHLKRAYELSRGQYGDADLRTLIAGRTYLYSWLGQGNGEISDEDYEVTIPRLFKQATTLFTPDHPHYYMCHLIEMWRLRNADRHDEGWQVLVATETYQDKIREIDPIQAALNLHFLGSMKKDQGNYDDSKKYFQAALDTYVADAGDTFPLTLFTRMSLSDSLARNGELEQAIRELETIMNNGKDVFMNPSFLTLASRFLLSYYFRAGEDAKAESLAREVLEDTASEYDVQSFLFTKYYTSAAQLSHEEATATRAWSRSLKGLLSLKANSIEYNGAYDYSIARCYYHLGNLDEHYQTLKQLEPNSHNLTLQAMNRAAAGDWQAAYQDSREALRSRESGPNGVKLAPYATVIAALVDEKLGNREAWIEFCAQLIPRFQRKAYRLRYLLAFLGQRERLPEDLENKAIAIAETMASQGTDTKSVNVKTTRIVAGGLAAWRKGRFAEAIELLDRWPYHSNSIPADFNHFDQERHVFRAEATQRLLMANCYARLNQIEEARKQLVLCDEVYEPINYDWWAPVILSNLRAETEELIQSAEN